MKRNVFRSFVLLGTLISFFGCDINIKNSEKSVKFIPFRQCELEDFVDKGPKLSHDDYNGLEFAKRLCPNFGQVDELVVLKNGLSF